MLAWIIIIGGIIVSSMILLGTRAVKKEINDIRSNLQEIDATIKGE